MSLYSEGVELALNKGLIETAMIFAKKPHVQEEKKKKLWLKIATHLLNTGGNNVAEVLKIINDDEQFIKIEDLLLLFNDNIKIDNFKDPICDSLEQYTTDIAELKDTIQNYSNNADTLKNDLRLIKNRHIEIHSHL